MRNQRRPDPRQRLRDKRVSADPHPKGDNEPNEDEVADELARLMGSRLVSDDDSTLENNE